MSWHIRFHACVCLRCVCSFSHSGASKLLSRLVECARTEGLSRPMYIAPFVHTLLRRPSQNMVCKGRIMYEIKREFDFQCGWLYLISIFLLLFYQIRILEVMRRRLSLPLPRGNGSNSGDANPIALEKSLPARIARGLRTPGHFLIALQFRRIPRGFEPASTPSAAASSASAPSPSLSASAKSETSAASAKSVASESASSEKSAAPGKSQKSGAGPTRSRRTLAAFWSQGTLAVRRAARWAACRNQV